MFIRKPHCIIYFSSCFKSWIILAETPNFVKLFFHSNVIFLVIPNNSPNDGINQSNKYNCFFNDHLELPRPQKGWFTAHKALMAVIKCYTHFHDCIWVLGNWLTFTTAYSVLQSHDCNLWFIYFFGQFLAKNFSPSEIMISDLWPCDKLNVHCKNSHKIGSSHVGASTFNCHDLPPKFWPQLPS